jgi:hypothetical protein
MPKGRSQKGTIQPLTLLASTPMLLIIAAAATSDRPATAPTTLPATAPAAPTVGVDEQRRSPASASADLVRVDDTWFCEIRIVNMSKELVEVPRQPVSFEVHDGDGTWFGGTSYSEGGVGRIMLLPGEGLIKRLPLQRRDLTPGKYIIRVRQAAAFRRLDVEATVSLPRRKTGHH